MRKISQALQLKYMATAKLYRYKLNYKEMFETLPPKQFLGCIFFVPNFARLLSIRMKASYENKVRELSHLFNYFHEDDLYEYFRLNHVLHKDKSKEDYLYQLFILIYDLLKDISLEEFEPLEFEQYANPIYIYNSHYSSELLNITRDVLIYGFYSQEVRKKHTLTYDVFIESLKEIYQEGLLPLDISMQSYF
jgi:hypothetical protein